jgi:predicted nucleic acid-binding protein
VIVVDASVAVKWFVMEEDHLLALRLLEQDLPLVAPDLIFAETANVLWKKLQKGEVTETQSQRACRLLPGFLRGVVGSAALIVDALKLARRLNHSVYDCIYLACSQNQGTRLVTADQKFVAHIANAGLGHFAIGLNEIDSVIRSPGTVPDAAGPESNHEK